MRGYHSNDIFNARVAASLNPVAAIVCTVATRQNVTFQSGAIDRILRQMFCAGYTSGQIEELNDGYSHTTDSSSRIPDIGVEDNAVIHRGRYIANHCHAI